MRLCARLLRTRSLRRRSSPERSLAFTERNGDSGARTAAVPEARDVDGRTDGNRSGSGLDREGVHAPRRQVEVEPLRRELRRIPLVALVPEQIPERDTAGEPRERDLSPALRPRGAVVDRGEEARARSAVPRHHHETVPGRVAAPRRTAFAEPPLAGVHLLAPEHPEEPVVECPQPHVRRLVGSPPEVHGDVDAARGSSWFSRNRAEYSWNSGVAHRCSRTERASPACSRS